VNRKKYFPSDTEEDIDLRDDMPDGDRPGHASCEDPRAAWKENHDHRDRTKGHGNGSRHQSGKYEK